MVIDNKFNHIDGTHCWYCNREYHVSKGVFINQGMTLRKTKDHIVSVRDGGKNDKRNYISCCLDCNNLKKAKSLRQFILLVSEFTNEHPMFVYSKMIINRCWKLENKYAQLTNKL